jgi:hypothetical protein
MQVLLLRRVLLLLLQRVLCLMGQCQRGQGPALPMLLLPLLLRSPHSLHVLLRHHRTQSLWTVHAHNATPHSDLVSLN